MPEEVREKILKAAREVFVEKGKEGSRMSEIAGKAGVNKALLHYYFNSKNELYNSILEEVFSRAVKIPAELSPELSTEENLRNFIDSHISFIMDNREVFRFILWDFRDREEELKEVISTVINKLDLLPEEIFGDVLEMAVQRGEIREVEPYHLILTIISLNVFPVIAEPFVKAIIDASDEEYERMIGERKDENFKIIWDYIKKTETEEKDG